MSLIWFFVIFKQQVFQKELYTQLIKQFKTQKNLEAIVENLEESLIMVKGSAIEYMNKQFSDGFNELLLD